MPRYDRLMARIAAGARILIDGATGTEIERRGVPQLPDAWNGGGALSHPDILREVHMDYIHAGAEIVISNTFATSRHALRDAGEESDFERYNQRAVEIAREARAKCAKPDVLVAGGISYWSWSGRHPELKALSDSVAEQACLMKAAGADLLMLEMMVDQARMEVTLDAALTAGLPVWVGVSCAPDDAGRMCLENGDPLGVAIDAISARDVPLISIMHTEVGHVDSCLKIVRTRWSGPVGVYAHSAQWVGQVTQFDATIPAAEYATYAAGWIKKDVQVIGGCCGLGAAHIEALHPIMKS